MAQIERRVSKRLRTQKLMYAILGTVAFASMLSMAVVAPNVIGALGKMGITKGGKRRKEIINRARDRLIKAGMLQRNKDGLLSLTADGEKVLTRLKRLESPKKVPRHWDKKWRILIFDIPEYRKAVREKIRRTLISIGFDRLQDSVWIYPYDCEDIVALLKADLKIGKDLLYLVVEEMEGDGKLREHFGLPKIT